MEMLKTQLLVGVALSLLAIGIATLYLYYSRKKNTVDTNIMELPIERKTIVSHPSSQVLLEKYDVFINFRGSDIRQGFLSHLTKRLRQEGIDVYVDERLKRGDIISSALMEAIEKSTIALVIFSKDYASSTWCLQELEKIRECKQVKNQIVVPVFYNVNPSHVRHQAGSYADAFAQHQQKFRVNLKKLLVWRSVLKETANLSGFHSSNFLKESDLIDGIVKDVLKKVEDRDIIEPKCLIGFEEHVAILESFMKDDSQEFTVLGIWGKGGIGKTTLARAIFDKFSNKFDSFYFVSNVREQEHKIGLTSLLEKILSVLLNDEKLTMKGSLTTQHILRRMKVLLVLDDVNTSRQLQYLLEENLSLGPNSKVIITSRDRHVFTSGEVHVVREVKELNEEESLQLFCRHAFKQRYPKVGYEKLSAQAIKYAAGLPLALEVLGLHLNSRSTGTWESALKKLKKYPNVEIQNVLRVSYDRLDIPEKVREKSREHPETRSRLNDADEIQDILENSKGTGAIEGIILNLAELKNNLYLSADTFQNMTNLRFLKIRTSSKYYKHVHLSFGQESLFDKLIFFGEIIL